MPNFGKISITTAWINHSHWIQVNSFGDAARAFIDGVLKFSGDTSKINTSNYFSEAMGFTGFESLYVQNNPINGIDPSGLRELTDISQLAYEQGRNYIGQKLFSGLCNQFPIAVYRDIGHPLTGYQVAAGYQNFPELAVTNNPVPGDIAQFLTSAGAPYNHVAIYAGNEQIITTTRASNTATHGEIRLMDIYRFGSGKPFQYLHYIGR